MYRIKTDIRQYKCESIDKVEKLIRNWVIRPNDLIYHNEDRDWQPIGEHPSFEKLFGILEEKEASEPDTVVTDDHPLRRNGEERGAEAEVTQLTERPSFPEDEIDARETDIFDAEQISDSLAEREKREGEKADSDDEETLDEEVEEDDMRQTLPLDDKPQPPEAPEGVEPPVNDEITVMTDKTLEMMKVDEDPGDEVDEEEATQVTERPTVGDDSEVEASDEDEEEGEMKVIVSAPEEPEVPEEADEDEEPKGVGRHDLPEEFFATNEISGPILEDSARIIDDLAAMDKEESVDDAWDDIDPDLDEDSGSPLGLRDTDELAGAREDGDETEPEDERADDEDEIIVDPLDETPIAAADEWDEDVSQLEGEETRPGIAPLEEFVSDGYSIPLPFAIGPDEKDVALGLKRSKKSDSQKDAVFPYPEPKKRGEVHQRVYYFWKREPRDLSLPIIAIAVTLFVVIAFTFAVC